MNPITNLNPRRIEFSPPADSEITLTPSQLEAITHVGPLGIIAGPGSGKTLVLAWRAYHLIQSGQCQPDEVVMLTFTHNAAEAMRSHIARLLDVGVSAAIHITTLHAFNLRLIRRFADLLSYSNPGEATKPTAVPAIVSEERRRALFRLAYCAALDGASTSQPEVAALLSRLDLEALRNAISRDKAAARSPEVVSHAAKTLEQRAHALVYAAYQRQLRAHGWVDFDDLVLGAWQLLQMDEPRAFCHGTIRHVLVDEAQDLTPAEWDVICGLIDPACGQLTLVGDPWQSVHGWRGAIGPRIFTRLQQVYPTTQIRLLAENQRSRAPIVAASNSLLLSVGERRNQTAVRGDGPPVVLLRAASEVEQARVILSQIEQAVASGYAGYRDIAIGARTHEQLALIEQHLVEARLPAAVLGHGTFWERPVVRHLCAFLTLTQPPPALGEQDALVDNFALRTVIGLPEIGLSRASLKMLQGDAPELIGAHLFDTDRTSQLDLIEQPKLVHWLDWLSQLSQQADVLPQQVLEFVLDEAEGLGYGRVIAQVKDLRGRTQMQEDCRRMVRFAAAHTSISTCLDEIALLGGDDPQSQARQDHITLATLHALKGLQFKIMIMAGVNEGLLPLYANAKLVHEHELLEELRLMHVGVTRAQDVLILIFTQTRQRAGLGVEKAYPSHFLARLSCKLSRYQPLAWHNLLHDAGTTLQDSAGVAS